MIKCFTSHLENGAPLSLQTIKKEFNLFQTRGRLQEKSDPRSAVQRLARHRQQTHPGKIPRKVEKVKLVQTVFNNMQNIDFLKTV